MDAVRCREWRIFPGLSLLDDRRGFIAFIFAHVPIYFFIFITIHSGNDISSFVAGFNVFLIIHLLLHVLFLKHKKNEFRDWISWSIIIAAAFCGIVGLFLF